MLPLSWQSQPDYVDCAHDEHPVAACFDAPPVHQMFAVDYLKQESGEPDEQDWNCGRRPPQYCIPDVIQRYGFFTGQSA